MIPERRMRVLVIDDERHITRAFWRGLHADVDVVQEHDAKAAQEMLASSDEFDVIFLDIRLNGISGLDVYQFCVRECPARCHRIVFISADPYTPAAASLIMSVNALFMEKPFSLSDVEEMIAKFRGDPAPRGP